MKLGFIGCGKMATALIKGVLQSGICPAANIIVSDSNAAAVEKLAAATGVRCGANNLQVVAQSEAIVLAVKPSDAIAVLRDLSGTNSAKREKVATPEADNLQTKLLLSIVAGLPIAKIEEATGLGFRVVRVMPNTPALILQGAAGFASGSKATIPDDEFTHKLFGSVGIAVKVKEDLLDAVTGLSGSGPAYVYTMIEALADGGVLMGLPRDLALQLAAKTVAGAAEMVIQTKEHPASLRDQVTSPGGTTIAGLEALEECGLRSALIHAVRAATERALELREN